MPAKPLPTPAYLRQRLRFEPNTGRLFWRPWPAHGAGWNTKYANKEAFTAPHPTGGYMGCLEKQVLWAHRVAWAVHYGAWPKEEIDHINHDRGDNRLSNMREASRSENARNLPKRKDGTKVTGVRFHKGKYEARIRVNTKLIHLGTFANEQDAVDARLAAEDEYGFHLNHSMEGRFTQ